MNKVLVVIMGLAGMLAPLCYADKYTDWKSVSVLVNVWDSSGGSSGSGYIYDKEQGHIITAGHVISGAEQVEVVFDDGRTIQATQWKLYEDNDVGFIVVDPNSCLTEWEQISSGKLGDEVCVIGSPFGEVLRNSLSFGHITGSRCFPQSGTIFLQVDAAINPGNSGGPVFNMDGDVVGIASMIYSPTGVFCGIALVVPSEYILFNYIAFDREY